MNEIELWESEISEQSSIQEEKIYNFYDGTETSLQEGKIADLFKKFIGKKPPNNKDKKVSMNGIKIEDPTVKNFRLENNKFRADFEHKICGFPVQGLINNSNFSTHLKKQDTPQIRKSLIYAKMVELNVIAGLFAKNVSNKTFDIVKKRCEEQNPQIFKDGLTFDKYFKPASKIITIEYSSATSAYIMMVYASSDGKYTEYVCLMWITYDFAEDQLYGEYKLMRDNNYDS